MSSYKKMGIYLLGIMVFVMIFILIRNHLSTEWMTQFFEKIKGKSYAPFVYIALYAIFVVFAVPGTVITMLSGPIFGFGLGFFLVVIGSNIGCQATFFLSRKLGHSFVEKKIGKYHLMDEVYDKIEKNGFSYLLYLRLLPIFPFNVINYLMGLTRISHRDYTLATFFGMLPGTIMYVYVSTQLFDFDGGYVRILIPLLIALAYFGVQKYFTKK